MRTIKVSRKVVAKAIERAQSVSSDWQAEVCEILSIPALAKRWQELNPRFNGLRLNRVPGMPHRGFTPDQNRAVPDWTVFAGYTLDFCQFSDGQRSGWNSVRDDYYCHSPSTAWDGIRRETVHQFAEVLRMEHYGHHHESHDRYLAECKIRLTD